MLLTDNNNYFKLNYLFSLDGIGHTRVVTLLKHFDFDLEKLFNASYKNLSTIHNISENLATFLHNAIQNYHPPQKCYSELETLEKIDGKVITILDEEFPNNLKEIFLPPVFLFLKGDIELFGQQSLAIVGTRNPSSYGKQMTEYFTKEIISNDLITVSGLARGIDTIVHKTTLKNGGKTIAVIGSGLDVIYPSENKELFENISAEGLIISEYTPGTKPDAQNFPKRNRLISGISMGTLIIESGLKGGALHTAAYAIEQGKEVFAIPGNVTSQRSEGTNLLIKKGEAKLVQYPKDIFEEFNLKGKKQKKTPPIHLNLFEEKIYNELSDNPLHIDDISKRTSISPIELNNHLLIMELNGIIKQLPGKYFIRC